MTDRARTTSLKLEPGKAYVNGYKAVIVIKERDTRSEYPIFLDFDGNRYHEDGCYFGLGRPGFNLVSLADDKWQPDNWTIVRST